MEEYEIVMKTNREIIEIRAIVRRVSLEDAESYLRRWSSCIIGHIPKFMNKPRFSVETTDDWNYEERVYKNKEGDKIKYVWMYMPEIEQCTNLFRIESKQERKTAEGLANILRACANQMGLQEVCGEEK